MKLIIGHQCDGYDDEVQVKQQRYLKKKQQKKRVNSSLFI